MPFFKATDYNIHYEVTPPLFPRPTLFLHGNMASSKWWGPVVNAAKDSLEKKLDPNQKLYPGILVDFPGCGKSETPGNPEQIDVRPYAQVFFEMVEKLRNELPDLREKSMGLVGHSTGGLISILMLAMDNSETKKLFEGAVTVNSVGPRGIHASVLQKNNAILLAERDELLAVMKSTMLYREELFGFLNAVAVPEAQIALRQIQGRLLQSMINNEFLLDFQHVSKRVVIVFGEQDRLLSKQHAIEMSDALSQSKIVWIADGGHSFNVENPNQFLQIIFDFC